MKVGVLAGVSWIFIRCFLPYGQLFENNKPLQWLKTFSEEEQQTIFSDAQDHSPEFKRKMKESKLELKNQMVEKSDKGS